MLRPAVTSFVNFYFIDAALANALFQVGSLLLEMYWTPEGSFVWWQWFVQMWIGLALGWAGRWIQSRLRHVMTVMPNRLDASWVWTTWIAVAVAMCTLFYDIVVHNTGLQSLQDGGFTEGPLLSLVTMLFVLLVAEVWGAAKQMPHCTFRLWDLYPLAGLVITGIVAVDMLAFLKGYYLVLIIAAVALGSMVGGAVFTFLMTIKF